MKEGEYDSNLIGPSQTSLFRTSEEIREDLEELISLNDAIHPKDIDFIVERGTVILKGRVRDQAASQEAEQAAREVLGVTAVRNELVIGE